MINIVYILLFKYICKFFWCKSPAAKRTKNRQPFSHKKNNWLVMFVYGLLGGIIITMLIIIVFNYFKNTPKLPSKKLHIQSKLQKNTKNTNKALYENKNENKKLKVTNQNHANNYDFYNLLPNGQISDSNHKETETNKNQYLLHLGSFSKLKDADGLKAKLALQGFEANIEIMVSSSSKKDPTYKVIIGPFYSQSIVYSKKEQLDLAGFKNNLIIKNS